MSARSYSKLGLILMGALGGVLVSLGITAMAQRGEPLPLKDLQQFANVFAAIKSSYVEPVSDQKLVGDAIRGMFSDLDPHSTYLDAEAFKEMEAITQGGFGGLGIEIGSEDGMPKVIAPIEDTPAARAGIMAGDLITHIDGKPTKGMSLNDAIKLMRGEPKTSIELTIKRQGRDKPVMVTIVRDLIKVRSVRGKILDNGMAYVRIAQFQERTVEDLARQLTTFANATPQPKGLILDLRNDPGGLLDGAIGVSSVFLDPNTLVVSTKGRIPSANREYFSRPVTAMNSGFNGSGVSKAAEWAKKVPMVVLVNMGSASASEIVAGALQDHKRAKILGNRTFGKGSVQSVLPLSEDTGIKITTALYYTPSGRSIQVTGVEPDIVVDDTPGGNLFRLPREADLQRHLANGRPAGAGQGATGAGGASSSGAGSEAGAKRGQDADTLGTDNDSPVVEAKLFEFGGPDDFQLQQAVNFLQGKPVRRNDPALIAQNRQQAQDQQQARAGSVSADPAEKKSPLKPADSGAVERFRITPEGVVPVK